MFPKKTWFRVLIPAVLTLVFLLVLSVGIKAQQGKITLEFVSTILPAKPDGEILRGFIKEWEETYPNIKIKAVGVPADVYFNRMIPLAVAGELPDIFTGTDDQLPQFVALNACAELEPLFGKYLNEIDPNALDTLRLEGHVYSLPFYMQPYIMLYRTDVFAEGGYSRVVYPPDTWDDFVRLAQRFTRDLNGDGTIDQWGFTHLGAKTSSASTRLKVMMWSFGAPPIDRTPDGKWFTNLDTPEGIDCLQFFGDLHNKYHVNPPNPLEVSYQQALTQLALSKTVMMMTGVHTMGSVLARNPKLEEKLGSFVIPRGPLPKGRHVTFLCTAGQAISKTSKHKEEAVKFMKFIRTTQRQVYYNKISKRFPVTKEALKAPALRKPAYEGVHRALSFVEKFVNFPRIAETDRILQEALQRVLVGEPAKDVARRAADQIRKVIAELEME